MTSCPRVCTCEKLNNRLYTELSHQLGEVVPQSSTDYFEPSRLLARRSSLARNRAVGSSGEMAADAKPRLSVETEAHLTVAEVGRIRRIWGVSGFGVSPDRPHNREVGIPPKQTSVWPARGTRRGRADGPYLRSMLFQGMRAKGLEPPGLLPPAPEAHAHQPTRPVRF